MIYTAAPRHPALTRQRRCPAPLRQRASRTAQRRREAWRWGARCQSLHPAAVGRSGDMRLGLFFRQRTVLAPPVSLACRPFSRRPPLHQSEMRSLEGQPLTPPRRRGTIVPSLQALRRRSQATVQAHGQKRRQGLPSQGLPSHCQRQLGRGTAAAAPAAAAS